MTISLVVFGMIWKSMHPSVLHILLIAFLGFYSLGIPVPSNAYSVLAFDMRGELESGYMLMLMYVAVFVFHYPHYHSLGVGGGTSAPKQEEVKRLPGGKIKKKVRLLKIFVFEDH
ncbi:unnamed protein product [Prunus armeniaca]